MCPLPPMLLLVRAAAALLAADRRQVARWGFPSLHLVVLCSSCRAGRQASQRPAISSVTCSGAISSGASASSAAWSSSESGISTTFSHCRQMAKANLPSQAPWPQATKAERRLKPVHHAVLHQLVQRPIDRGRMGDAGNPHPVEDGIGAHRFLRLAQAGEHLALIARKLRMWW